MNYYNDNDPYCAQWLRNLIAAGLLPPGDVDDRDIRLVLPSDLCSYRQCHFFAGIGGWPYAFQLAGYDGPAWTGSCPCQPFSAAGKGNGFADERHLWPVWFNLIRECKPAVVLGEQVASKQGLSWFDLVCADLEGAGYACGVADLCAAGVGAPHIRQRLWFVAKSERSGWKRTRLYLQSGETRQTIFDVGGASPIEQLAKSRRRGPQCWGRSGQAHGTDGASAQKVEQWQRSRADAGDSGAAGELADADGGDASTKRLQRGWEQRQQPQDSCISELADADALRCGKRRPSEAGNGRDAPRFEPPGLCTSWGEVEWLPCIDGKARPAQSGIFPLAHGVPARVAKLRAIGNAIVPQIAAEFIKNCY